MMVAKLAVFAATVGALKECQGFTIPAIHRVSSSRGVVGATNVRADERSSPRFSSSGRLSVCRTLPRKNRAVAIRRRMAAADDDVAFLSDDPFVILGLDRPTADKKVLKRAYKKRALKYHPDVVTDVHSSPEDKKKASDRFAKINGAYEQLMGKGGTKGGANSGGGSGSGSSSTSDSYGGWTPPHRRSSSSSGYSSASGAGASGSTDWRDYMPNYRKEDDERYDTGGDSFGQIFSDMFTGAASAAVSGGIGGLGGGIFNEFLEFLEGGAGTSGFGSGDSDDDAQLRVLLQTGTLEEVAEEMDDTDLVVKQLEKKSRDLDDEIFSVDAEAKMAARFSEKLEKEERAAELKARKEVVGGYLQRAQKRLLALQTRYKDLIAYGGQNDDYASGRGRGRRGGSWDDVRTEAASSSRSSSSSSSSYGSGTTTGSSAAGTSERRERTRTASGDNATAGSTSTSNSEDSWMNEGFGSSTGRRSRGSGRRGSGRRRTTASRGRSSTDSRSSGGVGRDPSSRSTSSYSSSSSTTGGDGGAARSPEPGPEPRRSSSTNTPSPSPSPPPSTSSVVSTRSNYSYDVPPHRRGTGSSYASRQEEDRRRMREVKVDEEFEKLKKELGL